VLDYEIRQIEVELDELYSKSYNQQLINDTQ
jgi:hypothetical protein